MNMRKTLLTLGVGLLAVTTQAGAIISSLPEPTEGVYVLAGSASVDTSSLAKMAGMSYVDWAALQEAGLPDNAKIKFTGGVLFDSLPQDKGYEYDFSTATGIGAIKSAAFPAGYKLVVPSGCAFRFCGGNITCDTEAGTYTLAENSTETGKGLVCDLELNGSMLLYSACRPALHGKLTGTGVITARDWYAWQNIDGEIDFAGTFKCSNQTAGTGFSITSSAANPKLGYWESYQTSDYIQSLHYNPTRAANDPACTLTIGSVATGWGVTGAATTGSGKITRGGGFLVYNGNSLNITALTSQDLFLVADSTANSPTFQKGFANVTIGNYGSSHDGTLRVSPNVNLTTGFHSTRNFIVEYRVWTNVVNRGILDVTKTIYDYGSLAIMGCDPANLPRSIKVKPALASRSTVVVTNSASWTMPFDFGKATAEEVNIAGCDSNCALTIPETGVVTVTNVTTDASAAYPTKWTEYPILTCNADGAEKFANWTVEFTGTWPEGVYCEKVVKDTGLYIRVRKPHGCIFMVP